jgi:sulfatase maturation enzyme AslB (radical SAM superfamily)
MVDLSKFLKSIYVIEIPMSKKCNLRCSYCYIRDATYKQIEIKANEVIPLLEPIRKVFPNILKPNTPCKIIPWGAEPLCQWDTIEEVLTYIFQNYSDCPVTTNWSTNATTTPESYVKFVKKHWDKIESIQLSLDGPQEVHDYARKTAGGEGSFHKVMEHYEIMTKEIPDFTSKLMIKSTLSPEQVKKGHFYKACEFFWEELKHPMSPVTLVKDSVYDEEAAQALDEDLYRCKEYCEKNEKAQLGWFVYFNRPNNVCSACHSQVCVDLDGSIYHCHGPSTDNTKQDYFKLGNVYAEYLDPKAVYRNVYFKYNYDLIRAAFCKQQECEVYQEFPFLCWQCPMDMHNLNRLHYSPNFHFCKIVKVFYKHYKEWGQSNFERTIPAC